MIEICKLKLKGENLSEKKDSKDFQFWIEKLEKVISIFEIFSDKNVASCCVVDSIGLFPKNHRDSLSALFQLLKNLENAQMTRVKFAEGPKSKSLYDFTRCFVEGNINHRPTVILHFNKDNGSFGLHKSISPTRKESLALNLFNSVHLEQLTNVLLLSKEDYFELLFTYIQSMKSNIDLIPTFVRLVKSTESIYGIELDQNWKENLREKLKSGNPTNGLLFTTVLMYTNKQETEESDTYHWSELVSCDLWSESLEQQLLAASIQPLCLHMSDSRDPQLSKIESVSVNLLKSYGTGLVTELVADWYVSWFLTEKSEPHHDARVALIQLYIKEHLMKEMV